MRSSSPSVPRWIRPFPAPATTPPRLTGPWAPLDTRLDEVERFPLPSGAGPEDVAVDPADRPVSGDSLGHLWRWSADPRPGQPPELFADTGGRPLGIEVDPRDGTVVFTDSSDRYPVTHYKRDLLEHRPNGRLLAYRPGGSTEVLTDGLYFPNGVALTPDESALLLVETGSHRLSRIPLATGVPQILADLPAYPDNVSATGEGTYWIALPNPRMALLERLLPYPRLRQLAAFVPDRLQPRPARHTMVALVNGDGTVLRTLHGPAGRYRMVTGVRQHGDALWLGSLAERGIARVPL